MMAVVFCDFVSDRISVEDVLENCETIPDGESLGETAKI